MLRSRTYTFVFFLALAEGLLVSINSPFLASLTSSRHVGTIYIVASLLSLLGLAILPRLVYRFGHKIVLYSLLALGAISAEAASLSSGLLAIAAATLYMVIPQVAIVIGDLYFDKESSGKERGGVIGTAYTFMNLAFVLGPLVAGYVIDDSGYKSLYMIAAITFVVAAYYLGRFVNKVPPIRMHSGVLFSGLVHAWQRKDVRLILLANFALQFFFSWMVIYTPIYLIGRFAFSYETLGVVFSIMLLPYVLLEYPLGIIADRKLGEKEILVCGFVLMAIVTSVIPLIDKSSPLVWAVMLFGTRVGAAMVESMSAVYFHKKVTSSEVDLLALFRDMRPLGYIVGPLTAALLFPAVWPVTYLFPILGALMLLAALSSSSIRDTK